MRTTAALLLAMLVGGLTITSQPDAVEAAPITFPAIADGFISAAEPAIAFGSATELIAGVDPATGDRYQAFMTFQLPTLTERIVRARLRLFAPDGVPESTVVSSAGSGWTEAGLTWDEAPPIGDAISLERGEPGSDWVDLRIEPEALATAGRLTLAVDASDGIARIESRESDHPPQLVLQVASLDLLVAPTASPSASPTAPPTASPTATPVASPTSAPTSAPTATASASPTPGPTSTPTPVTGVPPIPPGYGDLLRKDFSDGALAPFRALTYPNVHPGDLMIQYGRYVTDAAHISVHDGYLDLRATRNADGSWSQAFVGTGLNGDGSAAPFVFQYGTARVMARMNNGRGAWQSLWYLVGTSWGTAEIDWAELIGGRLTAHIHGSSADGQKASLPVFPADEWHEYGITKAPTYIAFLLDGREVARANVAMTAPMALLADAKVGLTAPDSTTPSTLFLQIAWWTVDPL